MSQPTIEELLARLEEQQARIESLEAAAAPAAAAVPTAVESAEQPEPGRRAPRMTRRGMVQAAAMGTAGLMGAFLLEPDGVANASTTPNTGPSSFTSTTATAAVTATNTGSGSAVKATAKAGTTVTASQTGTGSTVNGVEGSITGTNGKGTGVLGTSPKGYGIRGTSSGGTGVHGTSGSKLANAAAVAGEITSTSPGSLSAGVLGINDGTGGSGVGVYGTHAGGGYGVYGTAPDGYGVYGFSANAIGVVGQSDGSETGVYAYSANGDGVNTTSGGAGDGVNAFSESGNGVYGGSDTNTGVSGASNSGYGVYGSAPGNYGTLGISTNGNGVYGQISVAPQAGVVGRQQDASGNWAVYGFGNIGATGTKSAVVPALDGKDHVTLYCVESPECWFEDFGSARLSGGSAKVAVDAEFAHTVHMAEYHVFVQAEGECHSLIVTDKTAKGFVVRELDGGKSNAPFAYRIVARRANVNAPRLNRVTLPNVPVLPEPQHVPARPRKMRRQH